MFELTPIETGRQTRSHETRRTRLDEMRGALGIGRWAETSRNEQLCDEMEQDDIVARVGLQDRACGLNKYET